MRSAFDKTFGNKIFEIQVDMIFNISAFKNTVLFLFLIFISCGNGTKIASQTNTPHADSTFTAQNGIETPLPICTGANQLEAYLPLLTHKKIAIVGNQTSVIFKNTPTNTSYTHLVDSLHTLGITIEKVFAPEHGFRGKADAAELVKDGKDLKTGIPILSLYGKHKKPSKASLAGIELIVFDIQDVGVRFYTYISTLHYVMQACAENNVPLLILDRPNPNGHYVDGPTLEKAHHSFVGVHPIPLVHGMTIGEYAKMINGEGWLGNGLHCKTTIIPVQHYTHETSYSLPIRPSPNLPNDQAIQLYPSLGFFEGTTINAGRGTEMQFQCFGAPTLAKTIFEYTYTPHPNFGAKHPKHEGKLCHGKDLRKIPAPNKVDISWLIEAYQHSTDKTHFFKTASFTIHAGTKKLQQQIRNGDTAEAIRDTWAADLDAYKKIRIKYLLYP